MYILHYNMFENVWNRLREIFLICMNMLNKPFATETFTESACLCYVSAVQVPVQTVITEIKLCINISLKFAGSRQDYQSHAVIAN